MFLAIFLKCAFDNHITLNFLGVLTIPWEQREHWNGSQTCGILGERIQVVFVLGVKP